MRYILGSVFLVLSAVSSAESSYTEYNSQLSELVKEWKEKHQTADTVFLSSYSSPLDFPLEERHTSEFSWFDITPQKFFPESMVVFLTHEGECLTYHQGQTAPCTAFQTRAATQLNSLAQCYLSEKKDHKKLYTRPLIIEGVLLPIIAVFVITAGGPFGWLLLASNALLTGLLVNEVFAAEDRAQSACKDKADVYTHLKEGFVFSD